MPSKYGKCPHCGQEKLESMGPQRRRVDGSPGLRRLRCRNCKGYTTEGSPIAPTERRLLIKRVPCPRCKSKKTISKGTSNNGKPYRYCNNCKRYYVVGSVGVGGDRVSEEFHEKNEKLAKQAILDRQKRIIDPASKPAGVVSESMSWRKPEWADHLRAGAQPLMDAVKLFLEEHPDKSYKHKGLFNNLFYVGDLSDEQAERARKRLQQVLSKGAKTKVFKRVKVGVYQANKD